MRLDDPHVWNRYRYHRTHVQYALGLEDELEDGGTRKWCPKAKEYVNSWSFESYSSYLVLANQVYMLSDGYRERNSGIESLMNLLRKPLEPLYSAASCFIHGPT